MDSWLMGCLLSFIHPVGARLMGFLEHSYRSIKSKESRNALADLILPLTQVANLPKCNAELYLTSISTRGYYQSYSCVSRVH